MSSLNKIMLIGNLGRDPEIRYTQDGSPVATFSMATSENWTDRNGNRQEHTEWHNVVAWGRLADLCKRYLSKGRQAYVEGRVRTREWNDRDGNKRRTTEVIASQIVLLGSRMQTAMEESPQAAERIDRSEAEPSVGDGGITDSDIPF